MEIREGNRGLKNEPKYLGRATLASALALSLCQSAYRVVCANLTAFFGPADPTTARSLSITRGLVLHTRPDCRSSGIIARAIGPNDPHDDRSVAAFRKRAPPRIRRRAASGELIAPLGAPRLLPSVDTDCRFASV